MTPPAQLPETNRGRIQLRSAVLDDAEIVFGWRNLASIVEMGSLMREVTWDEHRQWFAESVNGDKRWLLIILIDDKPAGQVRFDWTNPGGAEVSVYLLPGFTGHGFGVQAIEEGCRLVLEAGRAIQIDAWVREDNARSLAAFRKAGFTADTTAPLRRDHIRLKFKPRIEIPHNRLTFGPEEEAAVIGVVRSGHWVGGRVLKELESRIARLTGVEHAIGVGSGLAALRLSLVALGVTAQDKVAIPAYSCVALANAVLACGAEPVPVDVEAGTWNLSVAGLRKALERMPNLKAAIAVHTFGCPAPIAQLKSLGVPIVEDCSHALGRQPFGKLGDVSMLSLHATKLLGSGEGGIVLTNDTGIAAQIRQARDYSDQGPAAWRLNDRMTDLEAALALCQLERLPHLLSLRDALADRYDSLLAPRTDEAGLMLPPMLSGRIWYRYTVAAPDASSVITRMASRGIAAARPVEAWASAMQTGPVSARAYREIVSLPLYPTLTMEEQDRVVSAFLDALRAHNPQ